MSGCARLVFTVLLTCLVGNVSPAAGTRYYVNDHLATTVGMADAAGEIAALEADAFGSPLAGGPNAARFTGKPYDEDLGAYIFRFRYYRPSEGRWLTADPSAFPDGVNGRMYLSGKPNRLFDALGLAPGDPFPSADAAAQDALNYTNPTSISENIEHGGFIYQGDDGNFYATNPTPGTEDGWSPSSSSGDVPETGVPVGDYHTHGGPPPPGMIGAEEFSPEDLQGSQLFNNIFPGWLSYLMTPNGQQFRYDPSATSGNGITPLE